MCASRNRTSVRWTVLWTALAALLSSGCGGPLQPQKLRLDEDICSRCRMAISEKRYAAQVVEPSGAAFFDDVGCMAVWLQENRTDPSAVLFVADYRTLQWVPAEEAFYVRSQKIPSPMGYGTAAFADSERALQWARQVDGRVYRWQQFRSEVKP